MKTDQQIGLPYVCEEVTLHSDQFKPLRSVSTVRALSQLSAWPVTVFSGSTFFFKSFIGKYSFKFTVEFSEGM